MNLILNTFKECLKEPINRKNFPSITHILTKQMNVILILIFKVAAISHDVYQTQYSDICFNFSPIFLKNIVTHFRKYDDTQLIKICKSYHIAYKVYKCIQLEQTQLFYILQNPLAVTDLSFSIREYSQFGVISSVEFEQDIILFNHSLKFSQMY